jgi:hypothetical protein
MLASRRLHPRGWDTDDTGSREPGAGRRNAHPEGEHIEPVRSRDERVRGLAGQMDEAVALRDLVDERLASLPLP